MAVGPRVLTTLSAAGAIVRASNDGAWTTSRPALDLDAVVAGTGARAASPRPRAWHGLSPAWLRTFGPGTAADIKWWLGSTVAAVRRALADIGALEVEVAGPGYLMPDDLEAPDAPEPWGALLPPLDPTTMGWYEREWYLGPHQAQVFDTNGNAGPTVWWDGRIVGGWRQTEAGDVVLQMLEDIGADGLRVVENEAARLTDWLGGTRVLPRFPSPLSKAAERAAR